MIPSQIYSSLLISRSSSAIDILSSQKDREYVNDPPAYYGHCSILREANYPQVSKTHYSSSMNFKLTRPLLQTRMKGTIRNFSYPHPLVTLRSRMSALINTH